MTKQTVPHSDLHSNKRAFWTPKLLAAYWDVSVRTITRELEREALVGHKFGAQWRVSDDDRLAYERLRRLR